MAKTGHAGDCTIYASLCNGNAYDGICTCGYGWQVVRKDGDESEMFSKERTEKKARKDFQDGRAGWDKW